MNETVDLTGDADTGRWTAKEAAALVERSTKTILRWSRDSTFPNADKIPGPKGDEWSIPAGDAA